MYLYVMPERARISWQVSTNCFAPYSNARAECFTHYIYGVLLRYKSVQGVCRDQQGSPVTGAYGKFRFDLIFCEIEHLPMLLALIA